MLTFAHHFQPQFFMSISVSNITKLYGTQKALDNVRPLLELKPRRVGGATYQVPIEVKSERGVSIAMRWIRNAARVKKGRPMQEKLAEELLAAFKGEGSAMKKREETHKMAEANKAFAHFRW